jgi:cystathionine beta-synthase
VWGIETYGSLFKKYKETVVLDPPEIYPYVTEGIGEDFLPKNVDFAVIDHFEKVTDKDAALMTRRIAREEGIFAGNSAGAAFAGLIQLAPRFTRDDFVVVMVHDHGSRYLGKMFNDDWMRRKGYLDLAGLSARDLVAASERHPLLTVEGSASISHAVQLMAEHGYSHIPVTERGRIVGSVNETWLYSVLVKDPAAKSAPVSATMQPAFPFVDISTSVEGLARMITPENPAVLVRDFQCGETFIITRTDLLKVLS